MIHPQIATTVADAFAATRHAQQAGKRVGLVPTMGALHEGHLSLVDASRDQCDYHVASIFVNPTQFGENEDLDRYPRNFDADVAQLSERGIDLVFAPNSEQMYPDGYSTFIEPPSVAHHLEGYHRPVHFRGVATIVLKLFNAIPANAAFFGEKDFQQCLVVRHMVRDLNLAIEVVSCPIIRDTDGIAMSSRNRYLSKSERSRSLSLSNALAQVAEHYSAGNRDAAFLEKLMTDRLQTDVDRIDYAVVVDANTLERFSSNINRPAVALIAAHVGSTRLIDNCVLRM